MQKRRPLLLVPLLVLALLPTGCFGLPGLRTTPDGGTGGTGVPAQPAISMEEASTAYGDVLCDFLASMRKFNVVADAPDSTLQQLTAAAALLQHDMDRTAATVRDTPWPPEVRDDMAIIAEMLTALAAELTPVIEATTREELMAAASAAMSTGSPETDAAETRVQQALRPPGCPPDPDAPYQSVEELRQQFILAGGDCPDAEWELVTYYAPATQAGNCRTAFMAIYSNVADRDLGLRAFEITLSGGVLDLLVGPNWILGAVSPAQYAERLGGTLVDVP